MEPTTWSWMHEWDFPSWCPGVSTTLRPRVPAALHDETTAAAVKAAKAHRAWREHACCCCRVRMFNRIDVAAVRFHTSCGQRHKWGTGEDNTGGGAVRRFRDTRAASVHSQGKEHGYVVQKITYIQDCVCAS